MKVFSILIVLFIVGCSQTPSLVNNDVQEVDSTPLYGVAGVPFDEFYISGPNTIAKYDAVVFDTLSLDNLVIDQRRLDHRDRDWAFKDKEKERLKAYFAKKVGTVFNKSEGLRLANEPGQGVLNVMFELVEFAPNAPKDDAKSRPIRQKILTRSVGDLSVKAKIVDSLTGEVVAVLADEEEVGDTTFLEVNDRVNNTRHLRNTMESWIRGLKDTLESLKVVS